ncbi:MAG: hypothetical protein AAFN81_13845, partial [Bacteroidota bacterium]
MQNLTYRDLGCLLSLLFLTLWSGLAYGQSCFPTQTYTTEGISSFTVPGTPQDFYTIRITVKGASGGVGLVAGGEGATISAEFQVDGGTLLETTVGKPGLGFPDPTFASGGGGGSAVRQGATVLLAAGGGSGASILNPGVGGQTFSACGACTGEGGQGFGTAGGGGGNNSAGTFTQGGGIVRIGGMSFGGGPAFPGFGFGGEGFGGGGAGETGGALLGGGGGGYTGGAAGFGGFSYLNTNIYNANLISDVAGSSSGSGSVGSIVIECISVGIPCISPDVPVLTTNVSEACPGDEIVLNIDGSLGSYERWKVYTGGCNESTVVLVASTTGNSVTLEAPVGDVTYHVLASAFDECAPPLPCATITVTGDNEAPTITCQDLLIEMDDDALVSITTADIITGTSDNRS